MNDDTIKVKKVGGLNSATEILKAGEVNKWWKSRITFSRDKKIRGYFTNGKTS